MSAAPEGWKAILDPGEEILWQGRPGTKVDLPQFQPLDLMTGGVLALAGGYVLVNRVLPLSDLEGAPASHRVGLPALALGLLAIGAWIALALPYWRAWLRRFTWYTLTNRRAFITTDIPGRGKTLAAYPITRHMPVALDALTSSVHFTTRTQTLKGGARQVPHGFEQIGDARDVHRMMCDLQKALPK